MTAVEVTRRALTAAELRAEAGRTKEAQAARRMLALAMVLTGADRTSAAKTCGMDRQTLRDWVHRYNAEAAGLANRRARRGRGSSRPSRLRRSQPGSRLAPDPELEGRREHSRPRRAQGRGAPDRGAGVVGLGRSDARRGHDRRRYDMAGGQARGCGRALRLAAVDLPVDRRARPACDLDRRDRADPARRAAVEPRQLREHLAPAGRGSRRGRVTSLLPTAPHHYLGNGRERKPEVQFVAL